MFLGGKLLESRYLRVLFSTFVFCFTAATAQAQFDLVTGQVKDANGTPYSGASLRAQLVTTAGSPVTGQPTVTINNQQQCVSGGFGSAPCQVPFPGTNSFTLDANGNIPGGGINLAHNPSVTPSGTQWQFSITISPGIFPPAGTGPQSFSVAITVNSNPLAIGTTLSAAAPLLSNSGIASTKEIYATLLGMKCDGVTDDSVAFYTTALNAAAALNTGTLVVPPGICILNPALATSIPNNIWIRGAGEYGTTLRIPNGNNSTTPLLNINGTAPNNITLSDFGLDGNAQNQTNGGALIQVLSNGSKIRVERMHLINSWADCFIALSTAGNFSADISILNNDFEICGHAGGSTGDVRVFRPLRLKVLGNRFNGSIAQGSVMLSSDVGVGQVDIGDNHFLGGIGFGTALGGGTIGAQDGNVHDNWFSMSSSATPNVIDISFWNNVTIHHNHILKMGNCSGCSGISDLPPAFRTVVDGNEIFASPTNITNNCIAVGGSATEITNNYCQGSGGNGISYAVGSTSQSNHFLIANNISKNNSQASAGGASGIAVFLATGGSASVSDGIIKGNHSYDDQGSKTQGWGLGLAVSGQTTGYSNFSIEGNDFRGNLNAPIANATSGATAFNVTNNQDANNPATVASRNTSLGTTTLLSPTFAQMNHVDLYAYDSAAGVGCTGNTTVTWTLSYTDPTGTAQTSTATETITTNGGATGGDALKATFSIATNSGNTNSISYATTYTIGTGCTTGPSYAALLKAH